MAGAAVALRWMGRRRACSFRWRRRRPCSWNRDALRWPCWRTPPLALPIFVGLFAVILCAAYAVAKHAEALAHHYGEPYGTLILTLSAVAVEVLMVSAMMLHAGNNPTMARDTIFSTLMLIINGQIGVAMLLGGIRHGEQHYNLKSSNAYFSMIFAFTGLGLFLPTFVAPESLEHLYLFLIFAFLALYGIFLRLQMKEHRYFFAGEQRSELAPPVHEHSEGPRGPLSRGDVAGRDPGRGFPQRRIGPRAGHCG